MAVTSFQFRELSMNTTILSAASAVMLWEREEDVGDQRSKDLLDTGQNGLAEEKQLADKKLLSIVIRKQRPMKREIHSTINFLPIPLTYQ